MPRNREYGRCRICNGYASPENPLSARGKHYGCGTAKLVEIITQMDRKDGDYWKKYVAGNLRYYLQETGDR